MVDAIKAVKSEEEASRSSGAPPPCRMWPWTQAGHARHRGRCHAQVGHGSGSEQGLFLCSSAPVGVSAMFGNRHLQNRVIQAGDQYTLLIENNGPGGFYTELGRTCVLGRASQEMKDEFAFVLEAQQFVLERLKPGALCKDIFESYNEFMRRNGRPAETRLHCHGQGYDMVDRPLVRFAATTPIRNNMNIVVHPTYAGAHLGWVCDNYLIARTALPRKLHKFPRIFELSRGGENECPVQFLLAAALFAVCQVSAQAWPISPCSSAFGRPVPRHLSSPVFSVTAFRAPGNGGRGQPAR